MKTALIVLSSILTLASAVPYALEIVKGKARPRVVTWFTWTLLTAISCAAAIADKHYATAILLALATCETATIVLLGLKHGDRKFERFDVGCQIAALGGLLFWFVFNSPAIAVIANLVIDYIGALPTIKHAWQKPHEETALAYALAGLGGFCTVLAADSWKVTAIAFPLYIFAANAVLVALILLRARQVPIAAAAALRDL